jgi:hypothetical protein
MIIKTKDDVIHDILSSYCVEGSFYYLDWDIGKTTRIEVCYRETNWDEWVEGIVKRLPDGAIILYEEI